MSWELYTPDENEPIHSHWSSFFVGISITVFILVIINITGAL
jgi:hypothetical protein